MELESLMLWLAPKLNLKVYTQCNEQEAQQNSETKEIGYTSGHDL